MIWKIPLFVLLNYHIYIYLQKRVGAVGGLGYPVTAQRAQGTAPYRRLTGQPCIYSKSDPYAGYLRKNETSRINEKGVS